MTHSTVPLRSNFSAASLEHFLYFNKAYTTAWKCIKSQIVLSLGFYRKTPNKRPPPTTHSPKWVFINVFGSISGKNGPIFIP